MTSTIVVGTLAALIAANSVEDKAFDARNLEKVTIKSAYGDIRLVAKQTEEATVRAHKKDYDDDCQLEIRRDGERLVVENKQPKNRWNPPRCEVDFDIVVPKRIDVRALLGKGMVKSTGSVGRVRVKVGKGKISADGEIKEVVAAVGSGDMTFEGLVGKADLKAGRGDVELTYARVPESGEVNIKAGRGDATVRLPADAKISARLVTARGNLSNDFPSDSSAKFKISMKAGRGDLRIKKR